MSRYALDTIADRSIANMTALRTFRSDITDLSDRFGSSISYVAVAKSIDAKSASFRLNAADDERVPSMSISRVCSASTASEAAS